MEVTGVCSTANTQLVRSLGAIYLTTVPTLAVALQMLWTSKIGSERAAFAATGLRPPDQKSQDLVLLGELIDEGAITPVVDRRYSLEQIAESHRYVEEGSVVVAVWVGRIR